MAPYDAKSAKFISPQEEDGVDTPRAGAQDAYTATWARLRSPSPQGLGAGAPPTPPATPAAKARAAQVVVWRTCERGLPALPRAWRTPDPSPAKYGGGALPATRPVEFAWGEDTEEETSACEDEAWARLRTPSPEVVYTGWCGTPLVQALRVVTPREKVAPPPPPAPVVQREPPPSAGSANHPDCCSAPCKYFWKANGCKDGAACQRCHLCKWVRPRKKAEAPGVGPQEVPQPAAPWRQQEVPQLAAPWRQPQEVPQPAAPWRQQQDMPQPAAPWRQQQDMPQPAAPWRQQQDVPQPAAPWRQQPAGLFEPAPAAAAAARRPNGVPRLVLSEIVF